MAPACHVHNDRCSDVRPGLAPESNAPLGKVEIFLRVRSLIIVLFPHLCAQMGSVFLKSCMEEQLPSAASVLKKSCLSRLASMASFVAHSSRPVMMSRTGVGFVSSSRELGLPSSLGDNEGAFDTTSCDTTQPHQSKGAS